MAHKQKIPIALREQVWIYRCGHVFSRPCTIVWCQNRMNVFDFECGHDLPESKGGKTTLDNLYPLCRRCNGSMGNRFTIKEWNAKFADRRPWYSKVYRYCCGR